mgnify:FL=1
MTTARPGRKWYHSDAAVDEYRTALTSDSESYPMLKKLKIIRAIVVNTGVIAIVLASLYFGGDPNIFGVLGLLILGGYNGVEVGEYLQLLQAAREVQAGVNDEGEK